jgi:hypothetical protein
MREGERAMSVSETPLLDDETERKKTRGVWGLGVLFVAQRLFAPIPVCTTYIATF